MRQGNNPLCILDNPNKANVPRLSNQRFLREVETVKCLLFTDEPSFLLVIYTPEEPKGSKKRSLFIISRTNVVQLKLVQIYSSGFYVLVGKSVALSYS